MSSPRWTDKAGAWISIGASPGALLLGANMAARHDGPAPAIAIVFGLGLIAVFCYFQGLLGLIPPDGHGENLTQVAPKYVNRMTQQALGVLLAASMVGWFGFNIGLGGAAAGALLGLPATAGILLLGIPVVLISFGGVARWNWIAWLTALMSLLLIGLVVIELSARIVPVTLAFDSAHWILIDTAAFLGFAAVFAVRAPDFTFGLTTRRDVALCVASLCLPMLIASLAGVGLQRGTGSVDLVGILSGEDGLLVGNLFVALAVIGPGFTTVFSGSLAIRSVVEMDNRIAMLIVGVAGLLLAITRFDRQLVSWLALLAATLPSLALAMILERRWRRNGQTPRIIPLWAWGIGSLIATILALMGQPLASLIGLALTSITVMIWRRRGQPVEIPSA
jgi:hypothetical protein